MLLLRPAFCITENRFLYDANGSFILCCVVWLFEEKSIEDGKRELKSKDERIGQLESIIQEKSDGIASLQQEMEARQVLIWDSMMSRRHLPLCQLLLYERYG